MTPDNNWIPVMNAAEPRFGGVIHMKEGGFGGENLVSPPNEMTPDCLIDLAFAERLAEQKSNGTYFDTRLAVKFYSELIGKRAECMRSGGVPAAMSKLISTLAEGQNAWLRLVDNQGFIHGEVIPNGTVTGRCRHVLPNLAQVPAKGETGVRCRSLFTVPPSYGFMVGADASGLELRVLAHYLAHFDNGEYARVVESGDIHESHRIAAGLQSREQAKEFIYALLYGAGNERLGAIAYPTANVCEQVKVGAALRQKFLSNIPAFGRLVNTASYRPYFKTPSGRTVAVSSAHTALHTLIQSGGVDVIKYATVFWHDLCREHGLQHGQDYVQCLHIHDEVQAYAKTQDIATTVGQSFCDALTLAGERLNLKCKMVGKYKIGKSWNETH